MAFLILKSFHIGCTSSLKLAYATYDYGRGKSSSQQPSTFKWDMLVPYRLSLFFSEVLAAMPLRKAHVLQGAAGPEFQDIHDLKTPMVVCCSYVDCLG